MTSIKKISYFCLSFLVTLFICELFLRYACISNVSITDFSIETGRVRPEKQSFLFFNEGFGIGQFNKHRYIGDSIPLHKKENTVRIALLGDSFIESFQIFERDYFGVHAEKILEDKYQNLNFEFLNFGRSGFDFETMYGYHHTFVKKFNPDLVLYMIYNGDLNPAKSQDPLIQRAVLEDDVLKISSIDSFNKKIINRYEATKVFTQNSIVINMLNNCIRKYKSVSIWSVLLDKIYFLFNKDMNTPQNNNVSQEINIKTQKIVENLKNKNIIIVNRDTSKINFNFEKICKSNGLEIFDIGPDLKMMIDSGIDPYYWKATQKTGHWNQFAHQIIGHSLAKQIEKELNKRVDF